jgi:tRNA threonylcarbamoyladenosine biosynthesis protein TsaE
MNRHIVTRSAEETEHLGRLLGDFLREKGAEATVCLYGDLGAGKTTFVKGFASAFGIPPREIGSASFVIVAEYETVPLFYHIDLYRLGDEACMDDIGLWEYIEAGGIAVIEWAEKLGEVPEGAISVSFRQAGDDAREIVMDGIGSDDLGSALGDIGKR